MATFGTIYLLYHKKNTYRQVLIITIRTNSLSINLILDPCCYFMSIQLLVNVLIEFLLNINKSHTSMLLILMRQKLFQSLRQLIRQPSFWFYQYRRFIYYYQAVLLFYLVWWGRLCWFDEVCSCQSFLVVVSEFYGWLLRLVTVFSLCLVLVTKSNRLLDRDYFD